MWKEKTEKPDYVYQWIKCKLNILVEVCVMKPELNSYISSAELEEPCWIIPAWVKENILNQLFMWFLCTKDCNYNGH